MPKIFYGSPDMLKDAVGKQISSFRRQPVTSARGVFKDADGETWWRSRQKKVVGPDGKLTDYGLYTSGFKTICSFGDPNEKTISESDAEFVSWDFDEAAEHYENYNGSESDWILLNMKSVNDSDGFITDYCLYTNGDKYICMFGDSEVTPPDEAYADFECETEDEACEWFDSYIGFDDEGDEDEEDYDEDEEDDDSPYLVYYDEDEDGPYTGFEDIDYPTL